MSKAIWSFVTVAILTALLAALSIAVVRHGYPLGATGLRRLDGIANAAMFMPLAAIYFLSAALLMILPLRAASFVLVYGADKLFWTATALIATIVGVVLAKCILGQPSAIWSLLDWRFLFTLAVVACHLTLDQMRRNILLRSLFLAIFIAATLACLFWTFQL
jgi:hypothetical protein